jgi:putative pyruvate formate lyase activating enzyme
VWPVIIAIEQGLNIPLVYNSGGYDHAETLKIPDGIFDIYMPDFKQKIPEEFKRHRSPPK